MEDGWDASPFRALHVCFLERSSADPPDAACDRPPEPRRDPARTAAAPSARSSGPHDGWPGVGASGRRPRSGRRRSTGAATASTVDASPDSLALSAVPRSHRRRRDLRVAGGPRRRAPRALGAARATRSRWSWRTTGPARTRPPSSSAGRGELDVRHVWQPEEGFRKARLLNRAALAAVRRLPVFLDGDCVPRTRFRRRDPPGRAAGLVRREQASPSQPGASRGGCSRTTRPVWRWSAVRLVRPGAAGARHVAARSGQSARRAPRPSRPQPARGVPSARISTHRTAATATRSASGSPTSSGSTGSTCGSADGTARTSGHRAAAAAPRASGAAGRDRPRRSSTSGIRIAKQPAPRPGARRTIEAADGLSQLASELSSTQVSANRVAASSSSSDPVKL